MLTQRRKLLQYLRRSRFDAYAVLISRIGLKDAYGPQDRLSSRYKVCRGRLSRMGQCDSLVCMVGVGWLLGQLDCWIAEYSSNRWLAGCGVGVRLMHGRAAGLSARSAGACCRCHPMPAV